MKHWKESKCEELKVHQRRLIQAIKESSRALELGRTKGAHKTVSNVNKHITTIVKEGVFFSIRQLVFVFLVNTNTFRSLGVAP